MTNNTIEIKNLKIQQKKLQTEYKKSQKIMQDAQAKCTEKTDKLLTFNEKYGRVLQLMEED